MSQHSVNVRLTDELMRHVNKQTGDTGLYENASEYVRALIRNDLLSSREDGMAWLQRHLQPGLAAPESEFREVSAADVIARNQKKAAS